jgi:hypothetical protein
MADLGWEGCCNVRDLDGLPIRGGGSTRSAAVVRADSLDRFTAERGTTIAAVRTELLTEVDIEARLTAGGLGAP